MAATADISQVRLPCEGKASLVKWKVKIGTRISQGNIVALYKIHGSDIVQKLKSNGVGIIREIMVAEGEVVPPGQNILKIELLQKQRCTHPIVMKDMCAECGADLRQELGRPGDRKAPVKASVAMVHSVPELIVSEEQALELGRADEDRLLSSRRLVLLVDLDQTLIHTTNDNIPPNLKGAYHFQLPHGPTSLWYHTKFRPGMESFLKKISTLYELHICTFGVRMYAHTIARYLDPEGKYFSHRILSRDECFSSNSKTANLKALFPCGDSMVCIIDDREDVWMYAPNLVHVKPYHFFQGTADINAPPGLAKNEEDSKTMVHKTVTHSEKTSDSKQLVKKEGKSIDECNTVVNEDTQCESKADKVRNELEESQPTTPVDDYSKEKMEIDQTDTVACDENSQSGHKNETNIKEKDSSLDILDEVCEGTLELLSAKGDNNVTLSVSEGKLDDENEIQMTDHLQTTDNTKAHVETDLSNELKSDCRSKLDDTSSDKSISSMADQPELNQNVTDDVVNKATSDTTVNESDVCKNNTSEAPKTCDDPNEKDEIVEATESVTNKVLDESSEARTSGSSKATDEGKSEAHTTEESQTSEGTDGGKTENEEKEEEIEWEDDDDYLYYLEDILTRIHTVYFNMYDQIKGKSNKVPDLKNIIPYVKRKVLKGVNILFSGVIPTNAQVNKHKAYITARALGAVVQDQFNPGNGHNDPDATTHVIAAKAGTAKVNFAMKFKKVVIVTPDWLWCCSERWDRVDERLFLLKCSRRPASDSPDCSPRPSIKRKSEESPPPAAVYDPVTGKRVFKTRKLNSNGTPRKTEDSASTSSPMSRTAERKFSDSYNPLYSFSREDIDNMDKEVEEIFDESDDNASSDDEDDDDDGDLRRQVLSPKESESSSDDSLSADFPKGWKSKQKKKIQKLYEKPADDLDESQDEQDKPDDSMFEEEGDKKIRRVHINLGEDNSSADDESENDFDSIGSVDEEMAAAVEKEFLSN